MEFVQMQQLLLEKQMIVAAMDNIKIFDGCVHPVKHIKNDNIFIVLTQDEKEKLIDQGSSSGGSSIIVDSKLSSTSSNPVQNSVLYSKFQAIQNILNNYAEEHQSMLNRIFQLEQIIQSLSPGESSIQESTIMIPATVTSGVLRVNKIVQNNTLIL